MHCYICVTYLMIICSAHPPNFRESPKTIIKRSLFQDVIESLRIRAQLPEVTNSNEDNNIGHISERFGYENDLQLPNDSEFIPRRNDRIEMPSLKYRIPKSLTIYEGEENKEDHEEEIIVYVTTPNEEVIPLPTTQKPKKQKRPTLNNKESNKNKDNEVTKPDTDTDKPFTNTMAGQSQIGNRESQTVVKPTVIVNFRGSVHHRDSDIRLERRNNDNDTKEIPQNIFNINQEIKLDKSDAWMGSSGGTQKQPVKNKPGNNVMGENVQPRIEEDMMMCETSWKQNKEGSRKHDILQIFLNV